MHCNPLIHTILAMRGMNPLLVQEYSDNKGGLLIQDLWHNGMDGIHDIHVMNNDAS